MKKLLYILLFTIPFVGFGQSMNITWEDNDGREFSINTHTLQLKYSMVSGDKIKYNTSDYYGPKGSIKETSGSVY